MEDRAAGPHKEADVILLNDGEEGKKSRFSVRDLFIGLITARRRKTRILSQVAEPDREIAERLMRESSAAWRGARHHFRMAHPHVLARMKGRKTLSLWANAKIAFHSHMHGLMLYLASARQDYRDYHKYRDAKSHIEDGQNPDTALFGCPDSRVLLVSWFGALAIGKTFQPKNVGSSIHDSLNVKGWNEGMIAMEMRRLNERTVAIREGDHIVSLSDFGAQNLAYSVAALGIKNIVFTTHGKCGCDKNAVRCHHDRSMWPLDDTCSAILKRKGASDNVITDAVHRNGVDYYIRKLGPSHKEADPDEAEWRATEIAHGMLNIKLVQAFLDKVNPEQRALAAKKGKEWVDARVTLVHLGIRVGMNPFIYNPERHDFVQLTHRPPLKKPELDDVAPSERPSGRTAGRVSRLFSACLL